MESVEDSTDAALDAAHEQEPPTEPLLDAAAAAIAAHALLPAGGAVVVAVSGGADSVALLDILRQLAPARRWRLHIAHVNHQLRGAESDADAAFVAQLAERAGLPCAIQTIDVARAQQTHASPENTARQLRYAALAAIARDVGARNIALAHHQDDQAETVLLHLLRGSGLGGLAGMRYASPLPPLAETALPLAETAPPLRSTAMHENGQPQAPITLARPLLDVSRADLRAYCARRGLTYREDSSNADTAPQRNWLRHTALPLLETRYPAAARTLARAARLLAEDYAYLIGAADDWLHRHAQSCDGGVLLDRAAWRALPPALQTAALRRAASRVSGHTQGLEYAHLAQARATLRDGGAGAAAKLPGGLLCRIEQDGVWIGYAPAYEPFAPIPLRIPGATEIAPLGCRIDAAVVAPEQADFHAGAGENAWLDATRVDGPLRARARRPGDRFTPLGMTGAKKLQDFLVDARVPARRRDRVPLVVNERDAIVWVGGHRIDNRYRVTAHTRQVIHLRLETVPAESPLADRGVRAEDLPNPHPTPPGAKAPSPWEETPSPWGEGRGEGQP